MEEKIWSGYFICPVCEEINKIPRWSIKEGEKLTIEFETNFNNKCLVFVCNNCGSKFEIGIKVKEE